ncbi:hypothetical protein Hanom_Chr03g00207491 [Helianthus anomalus]
MGVIETLPGLANMRTRRKFRSRRVSEILRTFDAAEALLLLAGLPLERIVDRGGFLDPAPCSSTRENLSFLRIRGDNDGGVTRLSATVLTKRFLVGWRGRCSIVYEWRWSGWRSVALAGTQMTSVVGDGNEWIVDPHPLEWYCEAIYTSTEVLAMFPGLCI